MVFQSEADLEQHLRNLIRAEITAVHEAIYALDNKKAVDIVICRDGTRPAVFFLEVKLFQSSSGRINMGSARGAGLQPEIIQRGPSYFESHLRWVIVDGRQDVPGFLLVPTSTIRRYLAAGTLGEKQNNIQLRIFDEETSLTERELVEALREWLLSS